MQLGRQTLSQAVSAAVLDRIRSGEFGPGDRLPTEKSLMAEYGVGRNSVREAVQALVTLGLVDVRPGPRRDRDRHRQRHRDGRRDDLGAAQGGGGRRPLRLPAAARGRDRVARRHRRHAGRPRGHRGEHPRVRVGARAGPADQHARRRVPRRRRQGQPQRDLRDRAGRGQRPDRQRAPPHDERAVGIAGARASSTRGSTRRSPRTIPRRPPRSWARTSTAPSRRSKRAARRRPPSAPDARVRRLTAPGATASLSPRM